MTRTCAVESCGHRQGSKVKDGCTFSKFPKNVDRCRRWLQALGDRDLLGLSLETLSKDRFVCSCHFNEDDYSIRDKTKKIKPSALPVKFSSNVTASSDYEILEFPPSTNQIIQSMRIEIPTSELCNLTQPKKHGVLNPIYLKSPESKQLQELSVTEDRSLLPITDFVELEDETMTVSSQGFINDDLLSSSSSQIPSFSSSPLSPSTTPLHSQIVVKSPSRSSSMFSGHSSQIENNLKEKSVACLKRPHSSNEISMPERKTAMDMAWNKENMDSNTSSSSQRSQYHSEAKISSITLTDQKSPLSYSKNWYIREKEITAVQQHVNSCKKIVVPREQWLLFKKINLILGNLRTAATKKILAEINMILQPYE